MTEDRKDRIMVTVTRLLTGEHRTTSVHGFTNEATARMAGEVAHGMAARLLKNQAAEMAEPVDEPDE